MYVFQMMSNSGTEKEKLGIEGRMYLDGGKNFCFSTSKKK